MYASLLPSAKFDSNTKARANVADINIEVLESSPSNGTINADMNGEDGAVIRLIRDLDLAKELEDQVKVLRNHKAAIRSSLSDDKNVDMILKLYLDSRVDALRRYFDWAIDFLLKNNKHERIRLACLEMWSQLRVVMKSIKMMEVSRLIQISSSIVCMGALHKDVPWLLPDGEIASTLGGNGDGNVNQDDLCSKGGTLLEFTCFVVEILERYHKIIRFEWEKEQRDGSRIMVPAESSGELCRSISALLKSNSLQNCTILDTTSVNGQSWLTLVDKVVTLGVQTLHSHRIIGKDVTSAHATALMCFSRLPSAPYDKVNGPRTLQILYLTSAIIDGAGNNSSREEELSALYTDVGFLPSLATGALQLPVIARLALLRGALSTYSPQELSTPCKIAASELSQRVALMSALQSLPKYEDEASILVGFVLPGLLSWCTSNQPPSLQLFAVQSLETWLNSMQISLKSRDAHHLTAEDTVKQLQVELSSVIKIAPVLMGVWRHPSKLVNHVASSLFLRLCDTLSAIMSHMKMKPSEKMLRVWSVIIRVTLQQPVEHRSRYHAITLLVPHAGAAAFVESQPGIFEQLLSAMRLKEVSSSCCSCAASLLRSLVCESAPAGYKSKGRHGHSVAGAASVDSHGMICNQAKCEQYRQLWVSPLVRILCPPSGTSSQYNHEQNLADYLLPELLKVDSKAAPAIMEGIRGRVKISDAQRVLWALVHTCLHARFLGVAGKEIIEGKEAEQASGALARAGPLRLHELKAACQSVDVKLRLCTLTALTASLQSSPIDDNELSILKCSFKLTTKLGTTDEIQKALRVVKALCVRTLESTRTAIKAAAKIEKKVKSKSKEAVSLNENDIAIMTARKQAISYCREVFFWLQGEVQANLYPGTTFDRELFGLKIIQCVFEIAGVCSTTDFSSLMSSPVETAAVSSGQINARVFTESCDPALTAISPFIDEAVTHTLLNTFVSSWDKSRRLAGELLTFLPRPLPGYESTESVASLAKWAVRLASSARQRESDAGALMIKVIFSVYALREGWRLVLPLDGHSEHTSASYSDQAAQSTINANDDALRLQIMQMSLSNADSGENTVEDIRGLQVHLAQRLETCAESSYLQSFSRESGACAGILAILNLIQCLEARICRLEILFGQINITTVEKERVASADSQTFPLCHGLLLATRYCVLEAANQGFLEKQARQEPRNRHDLRKDEQSPVCAASWRYTIRRLTALTHELLRVALMVVAEASTDVAFAPSNAHSNVRNGFKRALLPAGGSAVDNVGVKGPMNSTQDMGMAATYLNANSTATTYGEEDEVDSADASITQMCVVGAWMLVKEAASTLALLVEVSPPPSSSSGSASTGSGLMRDGGENMQLLNTSEVADIGGKLLSALGRLKHMGAIAEVQSALHSVAASLLRYGDRCEELSCLPLRWMTDVLDRLRSKKQVFILRRSAGFAYTFIALLRAEPKNLAANLLPVALDRLLTFAEKGMGAPIDLSAVPFLQGQDELDWSTSVHALNALRLILVDATLGTEVDPYIPRATILAVRGFRHSQWGVRNSSMMLFSSVMQRAVDNDKRSAASHRGTTAKDFFARFPSLYRFLLEELAAVTSYKVQVAPLSGQPQAVFPGPGDGNKEEDRPPTLYPILLLLSKFRLDQDLERDHDDPLTASNNDFHQEVDLSLFVPLLEQASRKAEQKIRLAAAGALAALTPSLKVLRSVRTRLEALATNYTKMSTNTIHGQLLMMLMQCKGLSTESVLAILDVKEINSLVAPMRRVFEQLKVVPAHRQQVAAGRPYWCPPAFRIYLELVRTLIGLVVEDGSSMWRLLQLDACEAVLQPIHFKHSFLLPYEPLLWKEALIDLSVAVSLSSPEDSNDVSALVALLDHPLSEVRHGVLEGFFSALGSTSDRLEWNGSAIASKERDLLDKLLMRLETETEEPLLTCSLMLINTLFRKSSGGINSTTETSLSSREGHYWVLLKGLLHRIEEEVAARQGAGAVVGSALLVMGWLLRGSCLPEGDYILRASEWVSILEEAVGEDRPGYIREAAAQAMQTSGVLARLATVPEGAASLRCRLWLIALSLLQDEDKDVRLWVISCIESSDNAFKRPAGSFLSNGSGLIVAEGLVQERIVSGLAQDLVMDAQDTHEGHKEVLALREKMLVPLLSVRAIMKSDRGTVGNEKVFEEEQANLYAERLVVLDCLNAALVKADVELSDLQTDSGSYASSVLDLILNQACEAADVVLECSETGGADSGELRRSLSGGLTFHREVYLTCSSALKAGKAILRSGINTPSSKTFASKVEALVGITAHPCLLKIIRT